MVAGHGQGDVQEHVQKFFISLGARFGRIRKSPKGKPSPQANLAAVLCKPEQAKSAQCEVDNLNRKIEGLTMELDFAKWASAALGIGCQRKVSVSPTASCLKTSNSRC